MLLLLVLVHILTNRTITIRTCVIVYSNVICVMFGHSVRPYTRVCRPNIQQCRHLGTSIVLNSVHGMECIICKATSLVGRVGPSHD